MEETLGKEFYESADKVITISRPETFENYLQRLKYRRTEGGYKYTDEDFEKYKDYILDCYETKSSVYKCLEFMYFAERDIDDQLFNREPKQETLEEIDQNNPVTRGSTALAYKKETLSGFEEGHKANLDWLEQNSNQTKQETLEEAAEKWYDSTEENKGFPKIEAFKDGAKWQQEKSYSEEDIKIAFTEGHSSARLRGSYKFNGTFEEDWILWFEQFKKK